MKKEFLGDIDWGDVIVNTYNDAVENQIKEDNIKNSLCRYLREPYDRIRCWFTANIELRNFLSRNNDINPDKLIENLPETEKVTLLEIRAVFLEVLSGSLEWGFNGSDGEKTMGEYVCEAFSETNIPRCLSRSEREQLKSSKIYEYTLIR